MYSVTGFEGNAELSGANWHEGRACPPQNSAPAEQQYLACDECEEDRCDPPMTCATTMGFCTPDITGDSVGPVPAALWAVAALLLLAHGAAA